MDKYVVVYQEGSDLDTLRSLATIEWEDPVSGIAVVRCTSVQLASIRRLPYVVSVEEPQVGTVLV